jgi:hypothetical protein
MSPKPDNSPDNERLRQLWLAFGPLKFPSIRAAEEILGEDAYDLADAEGYFAGLVETYLTRGRIEVSRINFDPAAHRRGLERLASARARDIGPFVTYATMVGELAIALSRATGVPLGVPPKSPE